MSTTENAKLRYILELSLEQIRALEADDLPAFDRILTAKRMLIDGLSNVPSLLASDPTLAAVVSRVQDADAMAQRLLFRKVGRIMRERNELHQCRKARGAYATPPAARPLGLLPDAPSFLDVQS